MLPLSSFFKSLPVVTVTNEIFEVYFRDSPRSDVPESFGEKIEALSEDIWMSGIEALVKTWSTDLLSVILKSLRVAFPLNRNPEQRSVMIKSIVDVLDSEGFDVFQNYSSSFLSSLIPKKLRQEQDKNELTKATLQKICMNLGLSIFFHQFNEKLLSRWGQELGVEHLKTSSKKTLIQALLSKSASLQSTQAHSKNLKRAAEDASSDAENQPTNKSRRIIARTSGRESERL